jgi:spermidine/putrescine transport system substrate-binding protein
MNKILSIALYLILSSGSFASGRLNVYVWGGEIPKPLVQKFEQETGIRVNFSTYDSNETLYAKLKAGGDSNYDVILPSGYFVERLRRQGMLHTLDKNLLPNRKYLNVHFHNNAYDPHNTHSIPIIWGITGLFYLQGMPTLKRWSDLWDSRFKNQVLLLDDMREAFSMSFLSLGYSPNDTNPEHIQQAYEHLLRLTPNVKLFASDSMKAIMIDEDAKLGMAWNGDVAKGQAENPALRFSFPEEGYIIWIDCLAIPKNAPHLKEAYQFINFILRPENAKEIVLQEGHAITNAGALALLPQSIRNNPILYPSDSILQRGFTQRAVPNSVLAIYAMYWQKLKMSM